MQKPKRFRDYSDKEIAMLGDERFNKLVQKEAEPMMIPTCTVVSFGFGDDWEQYPTNPTPPKPYNKNDYMWKEPTQHDKCLKCYEFRRYPPPQRHFGYQWWTICAKLGERCKCEHHKHDSLYA